MSSLVQCPACKNGVSSSAAACPHCGQKIKSKQSAVGLLAAILIGLIVGYFGSHAAASVIYGGSFAEWEQALKSAEQLNKQIEREMLMRMTHQQQAEYWRFQEQQLTR